MFYLIAAFLLVILYVFAAPKTIKGTLNSVGLVLLLVAVLILAAAFVLQMLQSPPQLFIVLGMLALLYYSMRDLERMPVKKATKYKRN